MRARMSVAGGPASDAGNADFVTEDTAGGV
jgi:hypothetical protein